MNESQREQRRETAVPGRRTFLRHSSLLIAGAAGAQLFLPSNASAQDARVAQDIAVLNYALTLERLEADFYITGLQRFGAADFATFGFSTLFDRLRDIRDHEVVHVNTLTADWYFALNTRRPPFNNLQARQAINFAANRAAYVKIAGGSSLAVPACQILPPNYPSYVPYCPYTAGSDHTTWTAPDLAKAKQLVQQSGTAGMKVVVNGTNDQVGKALVEQMISDLDAIGYKATPQLLSNSVQYPFVQNSSNSAKWNVGWSAWYQDYPAQSDFLNVLLGCGTIHPNSDASPNIAAFCDKGIQSKMDKALQTGVTDPEAANQLWAEVDHEVTDQAPWVDMYNPKQIDFLSSNVQGYQWSPQWYILYDQLWLTQ
jgi:peptide/nickel transport system substrate-binding protein